MNTHRSVSLIVKPGMYQTKFSQMVERLVQWYPMAFGILMPHDHKIALLRMQTGLGLNPCFCSEAYCELASSYQLTPAEITQWWIRKHDVSLGELHERLWHEASMAETAYYRTTFHE